MSAENALYIGMSDKRWVSLEIEENLTKLTIINIFLRFDSVPLSCDLISATLWINFTQIMLCIDTQAIEQRQKFYKISQINGLSSEVKQIVHETLKWH